MLLISVTNYLTQGYYGMSLCLREEWLPTLGVGNSKGLMDLVEAFKDTYKRTFQWRITKYGWDDNVQWHSMYSWFANDLGFWGTISVMFILGILLSTLYKDYLEANNPYAMVLICYYNEPIN